MSADAAPSTPEPPKAVHRSRRTRVSVVVVIFVLGLAATVWFTRGVASRHVQRMAVAELDAGNISAALDRLQWAAWLTPGDGEIEVLRAACYRRQGQQQDFLLALEAAEEKGADPDRIEQQVELAMIMSGNQPGLDESQLAQLVTGGSPPADASAAFIHGFLAQGQPQKAEAVLAAWEADAPQSPEVFHMRGIYQAWLGDDTQAQMEFETSLSLAPNNELARMGLAEVLERSGQWERAIVQYDWLVARLPTNQSARLGLARLLRKTGRYEEAREVLRPFVDEPNRTAGIAVEMAEVELDEGDYGAAQRWFAQADLDGGAHYTDTLRAAAIARNMTGDLFGADQLLDRVDAARADSIRSQQLQDRIAFDPSDRVAAAEYQRLASQPPVPPAPRAGGDEAYGSEQTVAAELYAVHCDACHGDSGAGDGRAARFFYPPPRNLRLDRYRIVSSGNGIASAEDVEEVLLRGMPGTSMRPFDELTKEQRQLLSQQVLQFRLEGARDRFVEILKAEDEEVDEIEVRRVVERQTAAAAVIAVPEIPPADAASIQRGKAAYRELACHNCHGDDGSGTDETPLYNDEGWPATLRDLVFEPMKGGEDATSLFRRIRLGMPGTPHPACPSVPDQQIIDLVHYCQSMAKEPKRHLTSHEQAARANQRALAADFWEGP